MPAGRELQRGLLELAGRVAPFDLNVERDGRIQFAQTDVNVRAAAAGMSAATVHLRHEFAAVRQRHQRLRANRRATMQVNSRMAGPFAQWRTGIGSERQQQMQAEKRAGVGRGVMEKIRRLPLVAKRKVQTSVAIHVGERDGLRGWRRGWRRTSPSTSASAMALVTIGSVKPTSRPMS